MRFRINPDPKVYKLDDLEDLSLLDHLLLEQQTAELGKALDMVTVTEMSDELDKCKTADERKAHPAAPWVLAVCIWGARRKGGDDVTFEQAIDFPMRRLEFLPDPADRKKAADPTRARSRQGSARAAKKPAGARSAAASRSKKASTAG